METVMVSIGVVIVVMLIGSFIFGYFYAALKLADKYGAWVYFAMVSVGIGLAMGLVTLITELSTGACL